MRSWVEVLSKVCVCVCVGGGVQLFARRLRLAIVNSSAAIWSDPLPLLPFPNTLTHAHSNTHTRTHD